MGNQNAGAMPLGTKLENAVKWGLPVSPLFLMILMMLAHAPYATPIIDPGLFYLACMAGAFTGFVACALVRSWNRRVSQFACWFGGILLEGAWIMLLYGEHGMSFAAVALGSFLVGVGSGCLLVLCLCCNQTGDVVCEVAKLAVGFAVAFSLYSLFSIMPHGGAVSYLFPLVTCIPLSMRLHAEPLDRLAAPSHKAALAQIDVTRQLTTSLLLASFGAGFAVLGFGSRFVEQGAGLAALLLVGCVLVRSKRDPLSLLRQSAMPLVVFALCYDALFDTGNPFAFFLAGCGALAVWLYLAPRFDGAHLAPVAPRVLALLLAWIIAAAGVGMGIAYFALRLIDAEPYRFSVALVVVVVLADFLWRALVMTPPARGWSRQMPAAASARMTSICSRSVSASLPASARSPHCCARTAASPISARRSTWPRAPRKRTSATSTRKPASTAAASCSCLPSRRGTRRMVRSPRRVATLTASRNRPGQHGENSRARSRPTRHTTGRAPVPGGGTEARRGYGMAGGPIPCSSRCSAGTRRSWRGGASGSREPRRRWTAGCASRPSTR